MIRGGCTTEVDRKVARGGCRHPPPQTKIRRGQRKVEQVKNSGVVYFIDGN